MLGGGDYSNRGLDTGSTFTHLSAAQSLSLCNSTAFFFYANPSFMRVHSKSCFLKPPPPRQLQWNSPHYTPVSPPPAPPRNKAWGAADNQIICLRRDISLLTCKRSAFPAPERSRKAVRELMDRITGINSQMIWICYIK